MESEIVAMQELFRFVEHGVGADGKVIGEIKTTGIRPKFTPRLESYGFKLPSDMFGGSTADPRRK